MQRVIRHLEFAMDHVRNFIDRVTAENFDPKRIEDVKLTIQFVKSLLNKHLNCNKSMTKININIEACAEILNFIVLTTFN